MRIFPAKFSVQHCFHLEISRDGHSHRAFRFEEVISFNDYTARPLSRYRLFHYYELADTRVELRVRVILGVQAYSIIRGLSSLNKSSQLETPSPDIVSRPDYRKLLLGTTILSDRVGFVPQIRGFLSLGAGLASPKRFSRSRLSPK